MSWKVRQFLFRKSFRQTTSNRWVPRGCAALDKRLRNDFVRGEIDLGWFVYLSTRHHFFKENIHCAKRHLYLLYWQVQNQYKEIEHVKGCDCLDRPNNERFIHGSQVFVNYRHKKYILRLFPFCDFASLLLLLYHFYYNGRGLGLTVGKQCDIWVVIRIVIAQWRDLVGWGKIFFALE